MVHEKYAILEMIILFINHSIQGKNLSSLLNEGGGGDGAWRRRACVMRVGVAEVGEQKKSIKVQAGAGEYMSNRDPCPCICAEMKSNLNLRTRS